MPVLFDVDDTLVDHRGAERKAALVLLRRFSGLLSYSDDDFVALWHNAAERHFAAFTAGECSYQEQRRRRIREFFGPDLDDQAADERFNVYFTGYQQNWALFPDVLPCLDALAGERLAIISNNSTEAVRTKLAAVGIADRFDAIITPETAGVSKPDARIFRAACEQSGALPAACLYVGDLLDKDARAAQAAGLNGVWLNRSRENVEVNEVLVIYDLREVPALLKPGDARG